MCGGERAAGRHAQAADSELRVLQQVRVWLVRVLQRKGVRVRVLLHGERHGVRMVRQVRMRVLR